MTIFSTVLSAIVLFSTTFSGAIASESQPIETDTIYLGQSLRSTSLSTMVSTIEKGSVVVVGEQHSFAPHQNNQVAVMQELKRQGHSVSVGMEFIAYPKQKYVDQFLNGTISEEAFKKAVGWGGSPFELYRRQILFSKEAGGRTIALNAPRNLTGKIARQGIESLTEEERALLPPNFELGDDDYLERFWQAIGGGHVPREKLMNYFTAQSVWDETMAWTAINHLNENPNNTMVIVVGDFHVAYGGGLPDRLRARGLEKVVSISQVNLSHFENETEARQEIGPHSKYGLRGDFIWTAVTSQNQSTFLAPALPPPSILQKLLNIPVQTSF